MDKKWADPSALGNMTIGLLILAQAFLLFGKVDPLTRIAVIPWILTAFPVLLIVVVIQYRIGDSVGAAANGLLGTVLLGQNFVKGMIDLAFVLSGKTPPAGLIMGGLAVDGMAFVIAGIILLFVGYLAGYGSKWTAFSIWAAAIGFILIAAAYFGFNPVLALIGVCGLMIVGLWLVYLGIAIMVNGALQKTLLPMGKPLYFPSGSTSQGISQ